jgi:ketosteroid isomerase-like protein
VYFLGVPKITAEQVRAEVKRFWSIMSNKRGDQLAEAYAHESTVFSSTGARPEPGRLAAARRQREYFQPLTTVTTTLGLIEVALLGEDAAVASYTFQFHASKVASAKGGVVEEIIEHGRGTQVFLLEPDGTLRIVHEHLSSVDKL